MSLIDFIKELNEVLVVQETLVAPTKTSGVVIKQQGCPVRTFDTWRDALSDLEYEDLLTEEQYQRFVHLLGLVESDDFLLVISQKLFEKVIKQDSSSAMEDDHAT